MRSASRLRHLRRAPRVAWDVLFRGRYDYTFDLLPMQSRSMSVRKRRNLLAAGLNVLCRSPRPWSWPIHLKLELVNYCDLRCPVCPVGSGLIERRQQAMDLDLVRHVLEQAGPHLLRTALYGWGEPLLYPRLEEALRLVRDLRISPVISTNGQRLGDPEVTDALLREPPDYLTVALDGLSDETNSRYRVGARLQPALVGAERIARLKRERRSEFPRLNMRFIAMKHNEHELPRLEAFAREHGFDFLSIGGLTMRDMDEGAHRSRVPDDESSRAYEYAGGKRVARDDFVCQQAFTFAVVLADGTMVACDDDYNGAHAYGRIGQDGTFRDVWFGERAREVRRAVAAGGGGFSFCRNCPFRDRPGETGNLRVQDLRT